VCETPNSTNDWMWWHVHFCSGYFGNGSSYIVLALQGWSLESKPQAPQNNKNLFISWWTFRFFYFLAIINFIDMNIHVQVFEFSVLLGMYLGVKLLSHVVTWCFIIVRNCENYSQSGCTILQCKQQCMVALIPPHPPKPSCCPFYSSCLSRSKFGLDFHLPKEHRASFLYLSCIGKSFCPNLWIEKFAHLSYLLFSGKTALYILIRNPLPEIFTDIFTLLIVSFKELKFFIFYFCSTGVWTQGHILYHLSCTSFCF
jgi:hypothetical protein